MASTATTRNRLEKQGTGENNNAWGTKLNTTALDLIDAALDGMEDYTLSGSKTLSSTNYAADESRMRFQNITGGTGGTVTIPALEKLYLVRNGSSGDVIFTTGSGDTATIESGNIEWVACDATNVYLVQTKDYGSSLVSSTGVPSTDAHLANKLYVDGAIAAAGLSSIPGLGAAITTFLTSPTSSNLRAAVSDETGTGALVFATSPTLVTPVLGTPTSGTLTNCTGFPLGSLSGAGTGVLTFLATPSSANLRSAVTDETGTGSLVFATAPTLTNPVVGTQSPGDNSTKAASTAYVDAAIPAAWTLIETQSPASAAQATFDSIPATYDDLYIVINDPSTSAGSIQYLQIKISFNNGSSYSTAVSFGNQCGHSDGAYGAIFIPYYRAGIGVIIASAGSFSTSPSVVANGGTSTLSYHSGGAPGQPIDAIQILFASGNITGDLSLYGRG